MDDYEKTLLGLKCCQTVNEYCDECPYNRISYDQCTKTLMKDTAELLEPVAPARDSTGQVCGKCGAWIYDSNRFCSQCGRRVKWQRIR